MSFMDNLGSVSVPLNAGRLLIKQNVNGTETDSKILYSDLVASLVKSSTLGVSVGQVPQLVSGTGGAAFPAVSGENLTDLDFSGITVGNASETGTTKLSDSNASNAGVGSGTAATPLAIMNNRTEYLNLLGGKGDLIGGNNWGSLQEFSTTQTGGTNSWAFPAAGGAVFNSSVGFNSDFNLVDVTNTAPAGNLYNLGGVLQWSGNAVWDSDTLKLSNSNNSTETEGWATTPAGVNSRIDYKLNQQVAGVYAILDTGLTQEFTGQVLFSTNSYSNPANGGMVVNTQLAVNAPMVLWDLSDTTAAGQLGNLFGNLQWKGEDLATVEKVEEYYEVFEGDDANDILMGYGFMRTTTSADFMINTATSKRPDNTNYTITDVSVVTASGVVIETNLTTPNTDVTLTSTGRVLVFKVFGLDSTTVGTPVYLRANTSSSNVTIPYI